MCNLYFLKIHLAEESHCWHTLCKFLAPASLCSYCHNPFWSLPSPGPYQELPGSLSDYSDSSNPIAPNLFGPRDRFCETVSSPWVGRRGMVWGWFKCVTFYFFSGCAGSSLLPWGLLCCSKQGLRLSCGAWASHCNGFSLQWLLLLQSVGFTHSGFRSFSTWDQ